MPSHEQKVAVGQGAELDVREHERIVLIEADDHVVAALLAVRRDLPEARKELRNVDLIAACSPGHKIRDSRFSANTASATSGCTSCIWKACARRGCGKNSRRSTAVFFPRHCVISGRENHAGGCAVSEQISRRVPNVAFGHNNSAAAVDQPPVARIMPVSLVIARTRLGRASTFPHRWGER